MLHAPAISVYIWLLLVASLVAMLVQRMRVPYALALVMTGLAIGLLRLLPAARLTPDVLFTVLLPPLLFEAAIHLRLDRLRAQWGPITLYSLAGTVLAAAVVGVLAWKLFGLPLTVALVFGALISPTDPIAVLAIFRRLGIDPRLTLLVEAESLFNDGIAVVLFTVLLAAVSSGSADVGLGLLQFVVTIVGGTAVGVAIGALASRVTRIFDDHLLAIMLTSIVAFGAYLTAEAFHVSGVIAVVAAGLTVGTFGLRRAMSPASRLAVTSFWEYAAFVANSIVFLLIGIDEAHLLTSSRLGWILPGAIAIVLAGRALAVYGLAPLARRRHPELTARWQHVLWWGGLRGALSMAMALRLAGDFPHRDDLVAMTFSVVLFSLLVQGLTITPLLARLGLQHAPIREVEAVKEQLEELALKLDELAEEGGGE